MQWRFWQLSPSCSEGYRTVVVLLGAALLWLASYGLAFVGGFWGNFALQFMIIPVRCLWAFAGFLLVVRLVRIRSRSYRTWAFRVVGIMLSVFLSVLLFGLHPFLVAFERSLRGSLDLPALQKWSLERLEQVGSETRHLPHKEIPTLLNEMRVPPPTGVRIYGNSDDRKAFVEFRWRGMGVWGLRIGHTNLSPCGQEWCPGVFFCWNVPD
jgi:hypothetical protein